MTVKYTNVNPQKLIEFSTNILEKAGLPPKMQRLRLISWLTLIFVVLPHMELHICVVIR